MCIRAIPRKPRPKVLNRYPRIWLALTYVIEASVWWLMAQADSKNFEPFVFYRIFTESTLKPSKNPLLRWAILDTLKSQRNFNCLSWYFLCVDTSLSPICSISFSSSHWVVGILWIPQFEKKWTFWPTTVAYISRLENDRELKFWPQAYLDAT